MTRTEAVEYLATMVSFRGVNTSDNATLDYLVLLTALIVIGIVTLFLWR